MMSTVTNTPVAMKYRRNVSSLSIDMSADNWTTTLGRHIDRHIGRVLVDIQADAWPICHPIYRATHLGQHIGQHPADMLTDTLIDCRSICRPICRSRGAQNTHDPKNFVQKLWKKLSEMWKSGFMKDLSAIPPCELFHVCVINKWSYSFSLALWN